MNKRVIYLLVIVVAVLANLYYFLSAKEQTPIRNLSTTQLLIPSLPGWGIYSGPEERSAHDFYLKGAVGGSEIRFMKPPDEIEKWTPEDVNNGLWEPIADMTQWVIKFYTIGYARQAYKEHYWVPMDAWNPFRMSRWYSPDEVKFKSSSADQFRIACDSQLKGKGFICFVEAQYDEFYVVIRYGVKETALALKDLEEIAVMADLQMGKYLGP
jgi:hypothetical protein